MKKFWIYTLFLLAAVFSCGQKEEYGESKEHSGKHEEHRDESGEHSGEKYSKGVVKIDPLAIKRMGVKVSTVEGGPVAGGITVPAEIKADPDRVAHLSSPAPGQLSRVFASVGDRVKAKEVLAKVRSIELGQARGQADRARANLQAAQANFARQEALQKEGIGARKKLVAAKAELARAQAEVNAARRALAVYGRGGSGSEISIRSPISGQVVRRDASLGEVVEPTQVLFEITDIERVWVVGRVYQQHAGEVSEGTSAALTVQAHPGRSWSGTIDYVAPAFDEPTRTLAVRMILENSQGVLKPGMFGEVSIHSKNAEIEKAPFIRADAIQKVGGELVVFVAEPEEGSFHAVPVAVGRQERGRVQVVSGLKVGDFYVSSGAFVLKSELLRSELGEGHVH